MEGSALGQASCECTASERRAGFLPAFFPVFSVDQEFSSSNVCRCAKCKGWHTPMPQVRGLEDGPTACGYCLLHHTHTRREQQRQTSKPGEIPAKGAILMNLNASL